MPRRLLGVFTLLLVSVLLGRAQGDVVLLTVGDEAVSKREFEYFFSKSPEKRADVFVETYARFKQKVQYAKELRLDTLYAYRRQMDLCRQVFDRQKRKLELDTLRAEKEWIRLVHVSWPLKQSAGKQEQQVGKRYLDSLYVALQEGGAWRGHAEELPWTQTHCLLDEWQSQLKGLERNEFSKPFFSPLGVHLVAWTDKARGKSVASMISPLDDAFRQKEMEEGLLVTALEAYWEKVLVCSEQDLEEYFKAHRTEYGGGVPHFRGAVIHCQSKKEAKAIKKYLKNYPEALWKEAVEERMPEEISQSCRIEIGLFAIGRNPYVDKLVFKCGDFQSLADYPYTWVSGKKLKKGPTDYRDVRMKVEKDCRKARKKAEMQAFMQKKRVEIDKEVLKTVNRAENK